MKSRWWAYTLVHRAIKAGDLKRPNTCELCGISKIRIVAHHWNGHQNPYDVWWVCDYCNLKLQGPEYHNGSITKAQARALVRG